MTQYLIIHNKNITFSFDYRECKTPVHNIWVKTDIFSDGTLFLRADAAVWPWFIFDNVTGRLYDMAPSLEVAEETVIDVYNGTIINFEDIISSRCHDDYDRAMSIL